MTENDDEVTAYVQEVYNKVLDENTEIARLMWEIEDTQEKWDLADK